MNFRRSLSLLLLLFVLCFALFSASFTAHASSNSLTTEDSEISSDNGVTVMSVDDVASTIDKITYGVYARNASDYSIAANLLRYTINAGKWGIQNLIDIKNYRTTNYILEENFYYAKGTNNLIASKGSYLKFDLSGIVNRVVVEYNGTTYESNFNASNIRSVRVDLRGQNGSSFKRLTFDSSVLSQQGQLTSLIFETGKLDSDLYRIEVQLTFYAQNVFSNIPQAAFNNPTSYKLVTGFYDGTMLQVFVDDGTTTLLSGILDGITQLPSKIWNLISDGLKSLFVPTELQMTEVKGQWDSLLSDRFGALYQTVQLIDDYADTFKQPSQSQSTIDFPEFRLPVGNNEEFVLQAHDVQIVPERFSFLVDVVKTIISIIATCLFINGLRNKFERLVGGQE